MTQLDQKINEHFSGLVVRKDLVKAVKGNAIVPSYVLEYLLGQYCATDDEDSIQAGIDTVREILRKHYVHRNEAGLVRSTIRERGKHKVIDKISVDLNDKTDTYEATFANLGINKVLVDAHTVTSNPKLLVGGVWCIADLSYDFNEKPNQTPWVLDSLKPIQISHFDFDGYVEARQHFTTDEWIDLLIQSIGFNPEFFGRRSKLTQLIRLIPFCERNYNLIELGPKGTGKSHIFSEFSPHGILISGGEVTVAKLFVNNATNKIGLVGYWDVVAFDEFAGKKKRVNKALVDILKNYMANKSFSRGIDTMGAEASIVFVGNTQHTVPYMLKHSDLFDELPEKFHDSAFLDRIHFYIPGWEVDIIRGQMFSEGYGFVVDYLAEILRSMRDRDYSSRYQEYFALTADISTRDRTSITKTFSGLMKILFPHGETSQEEIKEILEFAIEGRKRVKDQLMRMDETYSNVHFAYEDNAGDLKSITTLEEKQYPDIYRTNMDGNVSEQDSEDIASNTKRLEEGESLEPDHIMVAENMRGISYDNLFGKYLAGATEITVTDPYIRLFYQARNFMEFLETVVKFRATDDTVKVHLITSPDEYPQSSQEEFLRRMEESAPSVGIDFSWEFADNIHARHIITDHGWKISLDRGLDIFQQFDMGDAFTFSNRIQEQRNCKPFEVTYIQVEE